MRTPDVNALADTVEILYGDLWNFPFLESKKSSPSNVNAKVSIETNVVGTWRELREQVRICNQCDLHLNRARSVFGRGEFSSPVIFIGDFPSPADDTKGEIFSDAEGDLLCKMILAMKLKPEEMYFTNVFKCRSNRQFSPADDLPLQCLQHLEKEFSYLQAKVVVAMGAIAAKLISNTEAPLSTLRGQTFSFLGKNVFCTHHPRDLLQSPTLKKQAWEDLQKVMKAIGVI